jgi:trimethylamine--corrinoid protein Co-methyltransferase
MKKAGGIQKITPWRALNRDQMKIIDNAAYEILREVGVFIADEELLKLNKDLGGEIDYSKKIVKGFPEHLIRTNAAKVPKNFVFAGRDPDWDMVFQGGGRNQFWIPESGATERLILNDDKKTFSRRRSDKNDLAYTTKIVDGFDGFDGNCYLFDLGKEGQLGLPTELIRMDTMLQNTTKWAGNHTTVVSDIREHDYVARLGAAVQGGEEEFRKRPLWHSILNPLGSLQMNLYNSWIFRASFKHHFPVSPGIVAAAPLVGPATAAANAANTVAGLLWVSAMKGLHDPGTAVMGNNIVFNLDPFTGRGALGSAHGKLGSNVVTHIWHDFYGLPVAQYNGTFAASIDQMAFVLMATCISQMEQGTDLNFEQFSDAALDPAMIVVAAEIANYAKHMLSQYDQILPTKENLALELQKEVGAMGEGYMLSEFNMSRIDTFYKPLTLDTRAFDVWLREGAELWTHELCREKLKEFEKHEPTPVPKDMKERMDAIVREGTELLKKSDVDAQPRSTKPI